MIIDTYKNGQIFTLSEALDSRSKWLNLLLTIFYLLGSIALIKFAVRESRFDYIYFIIMFIMVCMIAGVCRFGNKSLESEKLQISHQRLTLIKKGFFTYRRSFDIDKIKNLRYLAKVTISKHSLSGDTMDYLGFQGTQTIIAEAYGENRIGFDYNGQVITFGKSITYWEFEELERLLKIYLRDPAIQ